MIHLKNTTAQGEAAVADYGSAALVTTIAADGLPAAQATFRHQGTAGYWYVSLNRSTGPSSTNYSYKLGPGESVTEADPPFGVIWALASGAADGPLSWYVGWNQ